MNVQQIATTLNTKILPNILGEDVLVTEDLSNIVDIGIKIGNINAYDKYVGKVINHIGMVKLTDRVIRSTAPKILKEGWMYGSIMELLSFKLPDAIDNEAYKLTNGATYNQDVFYAPDVTAQFYNDKDTWTIPMSFLANGTEDDRIVQSFSNAAQTVAFWSGIELAIDNALALQTDALIMRTLNNYIATVMYEEIFKTAGAGTTEGDYGTIRAVNTVKLYNTEFPDKAVTVANCKYNKDFLKFESYIMAMYLDRMSRASTVFNLAGETRQTPKDSLHFVTLSDFERATEMYLESDTFHKELVSLPLHEVVPFWMGSGTGFDFDDVSNVHVKIKRTINNVDTAVEINATGIVAVMFDDYAASVTNQKSSVTTHYNALGDFINNYYSVTAGFNNMFDQNFVVFFRADPTPTPDVGGDT